MEIDALDSDEKIDLLINKGNCKEYLGEFNDAYGDYYEEVLDKKPDNELALSGAVNCLN